MNVNQMYPATYLKAADLGLSRANVTISKVTLEDVGQGEMKPVLHFLNKDKGIVLNKTNGMIIAMHMGEETDQWIGQTITLYSHKVNFQGKMVDGIAVQVAAPQGHPQAAQAPLQQSAGHQPQPQTFPLDPVHQLQDAKAAQLDQMADAVKDMETQAAKEAAEYEDIPF